MKSFAKLSVATALLAACSLVQAAIATSSMLVTASVSVSGGACSVYASPINFGAYTGTHINAPGTISVNCLSGTAYSVSAMSTRVGGPGSGVMLPVSPDSSPTPLFYQIVKPVGGASIMVSPGTSPLMGMGIGFQQNLPITGMLFANQTADPGNYQDTVIVTVSF